MCKDVRLFPSAERVYNNLILYKFTHTFRNLFTKVYFCAAHISLSWKYFPLSHFFGGKVMAAARSFWIIFGRVATATENASSGLHFCVGLCFPVPPVAIIRSLLFSSRVVPETIKHIHEWNPSLAISVPFSRPVQHVPTLDNLAPLRALRSVDYHPLLTRFIILLPFIRGL